MMPVVNGLEQEFAGEVDVISLNAFERENASLQEQYGVRGHPSFVLLDGAGEVTERFFGPQDARTLREAMSAIAP